MNYAGLLRLSFALILLLVSGGLGFAHRSPLVILPLGAAFTLLYAAGKWYAWALLWKHNGLVGWIKALALTLPVQLILAGLVYIMGLGLGRLISSQPLASGLTARDYAAVAALTITGVSVSWLIHKLEGGKGPMASTAEKLQGQIGAALSGAASSPDTFGADTSGNDFMVLPDMLTPETLFSSYRGSNDYTQTALTNVTAYDGSKPQRALLAANDFIFAETEKRIGFALPEALKRLYRCKDGGSARNIMVARTEDPRPVYDDWISAFGGYEDLHSLKNRRTVHDSILDFAAEDDTEAFPEGAKHMLILSQWYQETTFLDYRSGGEPRVGLANFDDADWEERGMWFENFEAFFSSLRRVNTEPGHVPQPKPLTRKGPSPAHPDAFWLYHGAADHGAEDQQTSQTLWNKSENRLGVKLPPALQPYMAAVNGGMPYFNILPELESDTKQAKWPRVFPEGNLLGVHLWITLKDLSNRLEFTHGAQPWAALWDQSHKLIVISGSFDAALMLDYRRSEDPMLIYAGNLDHPEDAVSLGSPKQVLSRLRAVRDPHYQDAPIGDIRLSARGLSLAGFWQPGTAASGVSESNIKAHEARLDCDFPGHLKSWMQMKNGGGVRFRFIAPVKPNPHGYLNPVPSAGEWDNVFPDGLLSMEKWTTLDAWIKIHGDDFGQALKQRGYSQYVKDEYGDPANIIVLAEGPARLTLLDMSRADHADGANLVLITRQGAGWQVQNRNYAFSTQALRALRAEL